MTYAAMRARIAELEAALREIEMKVGDYEGMGALGGTPEQYLRAIREKASAAVKAKP